VEKGGFETDAVAVTLNLVGGKKRRYGSLRGGGKNCP